VRCAECAQGVGPRSPPIVDEGGGCQYSATDRDACQWVEADGEIRVGSVQVDDVQTTVLRNTRRQFAKEIAVGIEQRAAVAPREILAN